MDESGEKGKDVVRVNERRGGRVQEEGGGTDRQNKETVRVRVGDKLCSLVEVVKCERRGKRKRQLGRTNVCKGGTDVGEKGGFLHGHHIQRISHRRNRCNLHVSCHVGIHVGIHIGIHIGIQKGSQKGTHERIENAL